MVLTHTGPGIIQVDLMIKTILEEALIISILPTDSTACKFLEMMLLLKESEISLV
jgi:hypothetical protein